MNDAFFIITFSPVQPFIVEARRAADLYNGSRILVELAKALAEAIGTERLIYPAVKKNGHLPDDVPNKIVAKVPWDQADSFAQRAREAFLTRWSEIEQEAKENFLKKAPSVDRVWEQIWERQVDPNTLWELYWIVTHEEPGEGYASTFERAERALTAVKRARPFVPSHEEGLKDSLSGKRQALTTGGKDAKIYWDDIHQSGVLGPQILREGERLDAIGVIKRFSRFAKEEVSEYYGFPSTSSIAAAEFVDRVKKSLNKDKMGLGTLPVETPLPTQAKKGLKLYEATLDKLAEPVKFIKVKKGDFHYDGDLFYRDSLTLKYLEESHQIRVSESTLENAREELESLYKIAGGPPSTYYAVIVLDGDNMGEKVGQCTSQAEHKDLSGLLSEFASSVPDIANNHLASVIYNGGDDVMAMAPLANAFEFTEELASKFQEITKGTASAGIAISHHQSPLSTALREARQAEQRAKHIDDDLPQMTDIEKKAAVCIRSLKRSGETIEVRAKWKDVSNIFSEMVSLFKPEGQIPAPLASKFPYDVSLSAYALTSADQMFEVELERLINRHRNEKHEKPPNPKDLSKLLNAWAAALPGGPEELASWLIFARFVAQGGAA